MTIAFGAVGARSAGGTTTLTVAYPASVGAGDMLIAGRNVWFDAAGLASDEAGWTASGDLHGGTGTTADTHTGRARADRLVAAGGESGSVTFDQSGTLSGAVGMMARYTKTAGAWDTVATATGTDDTHAADRSVTASTSISFAPGDMLVAIVAIDTDTALVTPTKALSASGITFSATTGLYTGGGVVTGVDGNIDIWHALVTSGSGTVAPVMTLTTTTTQCGPVVFIRLREAAAAALPPILVMAPPRPA